MTLEINNLKLEQFFNWLIENYPKDAYTEIRLMNVSDDRVYAVVDKFKIEYPEIIIRNNSQFFIQTFDELKKIVEYRNNIFIRYSKMCYSINPRFFINGNISGSYDNLKTQNKIFFDIERIDHGQLSDIERERIEYKYVKDIILFLRRYQLLYPTIIRSGGGLHLIYKIRPKPITEGRKESYKEFISELQSKLANPIYHIDYVVDATRTTALPESINPKSGFKVHWVELGGQNDFFIPSKRMRKLKTKITEEKITDNNKMEVRKSLVWKLLTTPNLPEGEQNNVLLYYIKMLIRDTDDDFRIYQMELNSMYRGKWKFNPKTGIKGKIRNYGLLINFCKKYSEFCKENNIKWQDYKY